MLDRILVFAQNYPKFYGLVTLLPSWIFLFVVKLRNWAYDVRLIRSHKFNEPVISVGNIALGGTSKTPFVIYLCEELVKRGQRPAVLTRGYGSSLPRGQSAVILNGAQISGPKVGNLDEGMLQSVKLTGVPIVVGADRFAAAKQFLDTAEEKPTVWVLDDGFQHRRIHRDLDFVLLGVVDAEKNFAVLPRGPNREPVSHLARADMVFASEESSYLLLEFIARSSKREVTRFETCANTLLKASKVGRSELPSGSNVIAVGAIANPDRFKNTIEGIGYKVAVTRFFADHAAIDLNMINDLTHMGLPIVVTEKDYYRNINFWQGLRVEAFVLPIALKLKSADATKFDAKIKPLFHL